MTRWIADYQFDRPGAQVASIRIHAASSHYLEPAVAYFDETGREWLATTLVRVTGPTDLAGSASPSVYQDLGDSGELTARQTRRIQPGKARRTLMEDLYASRGAPGWATELLADDWRALLEQPSSRAATLAVAAARYVAAIEAGERAPVAKVATDLGLRQSQVRDRIYKARQLGLLEPQDKARGRARGQLTQAAIDLLKEGSR
jgi:hypothetical protein